MRPGPLPPALVAAAVFLLALTLPLLFWQATPDAAWPSSAARLRLARRDPLPDAHRDPRLEAR